MFHVMRIPLAPSSYPFQMYSTPLSNLGSSVDNSLSASKVIHVDTEIPCHSKLGVGRGCLLPRKNSIVSKPWARGGHGTKTGRSVTQEEGEESESRKEELYATYISEAFSFFGRNCEVSTNYLILSQIYNVARGCVS